MVRVASKALWVSVCQGLKLDSTEVGLLEEGLGTRQYQGGVGTV